MFAQTKNKEEVLNQLESNLNKEVVIHFRCTDCGDEQVTDEMEIDETMIEDMKNNGHIMIGLPCTECGTRTTFIHEEDFLGIEK